MTWEIAFRIFDAVMATAVLLVALGRWGGKLESRRREPILAPASGSISDLERRLGSVEKEQEGCVTRYEFQLNEKDNQRVHDGFRSEIKRLGEMDSAQERRIDRLMGQG